LPGPIDDVMMRSLSTGSLKIGFEDINLDSKNDNGTHRASLENE